MRKHKQLLNLQVYNVQAPPSRFQRHCVNTTTTQCTTCYNQGTAHSQKYFEHIKRDKTNTVSTNHYCDDLKGATKTPTGRWQENLLNCRTCKRNLVKFLGKYLLQRVGAHLHPHQTLYVAGAFDGSITDTAWFVKGGNSAQPDPSFTCNSEETDTRLWLHATRTSSTRVLILSPDTDTYHIGLPLQCTTDKQITIQISAVNSRQLKFLNLTELCSALARDPDLAGIDHTSLRHILQTLYAVSGCDYTSFFSHIGKATFL